MLNLSTLNYIFKRLIRKFIFSNQVTYQIKKIYPHFLFSNLSEIRPNEIFNRYKSILEQEKIAIEGKIVLEIGTGSTLSTGYLIASSKANTYISYEPYVQFNNQLNIKILKSLNLNPLAYSETKINQVSNLHKIEDQSIDLILSSSVLEHVVDMEMLVKDLKRVLKPEGLMIHWVDYRDHYFKYPYHFLLFSKKIWDRYFNPGSLPRWRISDHINQFSREGFEVKTLKSEILAEDFSKIKDKLHTEFSAYTLESLQVSGAFLKIYTKKK